MHGLGLQIIQTGLDPDQHFRRGKLIISSRLKYCAQGERRMPETRIFAQGLLFTLTVLSIPMVSSLKSASQQSDLFGIPDAQSQQLVSGRQSSPSSAPPALADCAFTAVWNIKNSQRCHAKFGVDLNLASYGIKTNSLTGKGVLAYFSHENLGRLPYIQHGKFVNGGLPQLVNMTAHLEKAAGDILAAIPDANYSGLGVIDWEFWSPAWNKNMHSAKVYVTESIDLVRLRHPTWDLATVEAAAKTEFEEAARSLFEGTILLARRLRPKALFGFYHFPYCQNRDDARHCKPLTLASNDELLWLADASSALYPSIYMKQKNIRASSAVYIETILQEALRVRNSSRSPTLPIYSYCALNYTFSGYYLNLEDLRNSILLSAEQGLAGVVFWGDNNDTSNRAACLDLQGYIKAALGPLVQKTTKAAARCSAALCSGHGRCVGKILECVPKGVQALSRTPSRVTGSANVTFVEKMPSECRCQCYEGWNGDNCDHCT
ncbi:hyaluronidase-1-like isoform X3 [Acanthaster planci]|nr:hyaluronidase-1-like isoform X3 [Acanthaster planci]XP_022080855.1 hyaluronidase-1-like isoform X3 [Acanthaster planci]XP_022080856.1 hyaluronidase-1-like isoform X3 [Acanthaster planci]XP_022080857.1 hyaluronidase-1-like isoform X3 [Acanthaster planci]XP_022080859.1 hyaluronidase-1-like isoform X3 [Acanthaster planci]